MVKLLAAGIMLLDHIGMILFPEAFWLRIIGRLSMPLFAYGIARGFYFSERKGATLQYIKKLLFFAAVSQIPYTILSLWVKGGFELNIGFTWLLSVVYMKTLRVANRSMRVTRVAVLICALFVPIDYGVYGVLFPYVLYAYMFDTYKPQYAFVGITLLFALNSFLEHNIMQAFSLIAFPLLLLTKQFDAKIRLSRRFYYWFYPLHLSMLMIIKYAIDIL